MIIFSDYHHGGLYNSLKLLSKRLGADIYRPIGREWFEQGYFKIAEPYGNHPDTITQYLSTEPYESVPFYCNPNAEQESYPGLYRISDPAHNSEDYAITLDAFKQIKVDVIIVSYPWHLESWIGLRNYFQPHAKIVLQVGNNGWTRFFDQAKNILSSARHQSGTYIPKNLNYVEYHQEFSTRLFSPHDKKWGPGEQPYVASFVNCLPESEKFDRLKYLLGNFRSEFPDAIGNYFRWWAFGAACPDGTITGIDEIARIMRSARFGYHNKPGGDGYGHVLHNWFACGIPLIGYPEQYAGTLGEDLFDVTTSVKPDPEAIVEANKPENYLLLKAKVMNRWLNTVSFDYEFENRLKPFFENLK